MNMENKHVMFVNLPQAKQMELLNRYAKAGIITKDEYETRWKELNLPEDEILLSEELL